MAKEELEVLTDINENSIHLLSPVDIFAIYLLFWEL
jgi:hypothetical protein